MQPPPQAAPPGAGPPPPLATSRNMYWRNSPFGRRANTAPGPVPPVTDPFAFGKQAPRGPPLLSSTPKGDPPGMQGYSPVAFPPPAADHPPLPHPHAAEGTHGLSPSLPAPVSQPAANSVFPSMAAPSPPFPAHLTNNIEMPLNGERGPHHHPLGQPHSMGMAFENALGGHQGLASVPNRPPSGQGAGGTPSHPGSVPMSSSFVPSAQQTVPQWKPSQGTLHPQGHPYSPYPEPPPQNALYAATQSSGSVSQPGPHLGPHHQSPPQQSVVHHATQPLMRYSEASAVTGTENASHRLAAWQNTGGTSPWPGPLPQEHFYLQPLESTYPLSGPATQENSSSAHPRGVSEAPGGQCPSDADSGTISMFFKGDEAENEEILSSERADHASSGAEVDAFQQTMGHTYYQPLHSQQIPTAPFSPFPAHAGLAAEGTDPGASFRTTSEQRDLQAAQNAAFVAGDKTSLAGARGPQYENVENLECVQNQEVLPSELPPSQDRLPAGAILDPNRYASLLGPLHPKNSLAGRLEGGPNLEAPDSFPRPVRPDSVSSNYSTLSHRSVSGSARPQELSGTFIQQESGKPEEEEEEADAASGFFKQIDSSPLGGDAPRQRCHGSLSQVPPTPSPPKPTGVFQTSANSSFEPVRSHGLGVKPMGVDQAKMVAELHESHPSQRSAKKSPAAPVSSPRNLEQPPDNLETLFMPQTHPLPLLASGSSSAGSALPPPGASAVENLQNFPEKKPLSRAQGGGKKCESPATTLWAESELPNFGGSVLLAPAAPAVYVPAKQSVQVVQPPEEGLPGRQPGPVPLLAGNSSSENLENPPKMGDEEALRSQASSGYASLLSSPPTEALQNQPVLITQPNHGCSLAPPVNLSLANQLNKNDSNHLAQDPRVASKSLLGLHGSGHPSGEINMPLPVGQPGSPSHLPLASAALSNSHFLQAPLSASETALNRSQALLQPDSQGPLNLASESPKAKAAGSQGAVGLDLTPPALATVPGGARHGTPKSSPSSHEPSRPLDFTIPKVPEQSLATSCTPGHNQPLSTGVVSPQPASHISQGETEAHDQPHFYQQVTKDAQPQGPLGTATPLMQQGASHQPFVPSNHQVPAGSTSAQPPPPNHRPYSAERSPAQPPATFAPTHVENMLGSSGQPPRSVTAPAGQPSASGAAPSGVSGAGQPAGPPSQLEQQQPPPSQNAFAPPPAPPYNYYYGYPYDSYSSYQQPYPPVDPRTAHLYYQEDPYARYDPSHQQYAYRNTTGRPQPAERERPSSRASHTSERPPSRQGYPEDYYKSGWSDYYADYYMNPYDYGGGGYLSRYAYDPRYRDPTAYDQSYWYNPEQSHLQKREGNYPQGNSHDREEDYWRYDPRCAGSFDDDLEPRRDLLGGDAFDRRSVHSEHSGHSLCSSRSRQSSFSSRSQQSQLYRSNQDLTASAYEADPQPTSLHTEYPLGGYAHFDRQPPFADSYLAQTAWPLEEPVPTRPLTPEKFSVPHICGRFGPGGYLIKALPNLPSEGQPALVEIHSMEVVMRSSAEQEGMRAFPGPLTKDETHKVDVINFAQNKATRSFQNDTLIDKESARLLWDFVVLLCRQNGTVVGTDIAELLLRDHRTVWLPGKSPNEANLIDFTNEALEQAEEESGEAQLSSLTSSLIATIDSIEKETERFRELLLYGRKKDALESAMKHGLWGHALLLASKMDRRTHASVMTRFANSLPMNDPLQTVYQLMSGRMPAASTFCGDEKWGDWRPHLAMVLSNLTNNMDVETRTITTMGDTLASKGLLDAAHFCYLMAQVGFGVYTKKTTKLVLIGSNHSLPFLKFASNEAIQRTEAYEYAQSLGTQPGCLPNFQVFKFIYACRLAEVGLAAQAFHYCEVISKAVLTSPCYYSPVLISQLIQISSQLRLFDPQLKEKPEEELFLEPGWLVQLRSLDGQIKEGCALYSVGRYTPQPYSCSTPSSEVEHAGQDEGTTGAAQETSSANPLLAPLHPLQSSIQLMPSAPQAILDNAATTAPSSHQDVAGVVPFYSVAPPPGEPGAGHSHPYGAEQIPAYPGAAMVPPAGSFSHPNELQMQEQHVSQEAGVQGAPQDYQAWKAGPEARGDDFYEKMASMVPGRRSRSTSQSSAQMGWGRRSRTTSESSVHSVGRERRNSAAKQPSPPPPPIPEGKASKKGPAPRKGGTWFGWLIGKGKNEAHLPDDKNKSIVWDEKKQRWVNMDEPEEESKPPPPPPTGFPQVPPAAPSVPGGPPNSSVNVFSRRAAGSRARYVDILNPSGAKSTSAAPAPSDLFAPLAPMPIPANLFVPNSVPEDQQPLEDKRTEGQVAPGGQPNPETAPELPHLNPAMFPPGAELHPSPAEDFQSGEPPVGGPPTGSVQFYNPSQFAQPAATSGSSRLGRIGQRKYPTLK